MKKTILFFSIFCLLTQIQAQGVLDQPDQDLDWESYRDLNEASYENKLEALKSKGLRPVDVEVLGGSTRKYAAVFRKNTDGRAWEVRTKLTDSEFSTKWTQMKDNGFRPVDQETHDLGNTTYYGAIWIKNTEGYKWASFRKLTSEEFSAKFDEYKAGYVPVDIDAYPINGKIHYSVIWVENKNNIDFVLQRDIPQANFGNLFDSWSDKGYRLYSTESYTRNGNQEYATIWVKEANNMKWAARRDMNATWFHNWWLKYRDLGYRLEDIEVYQTNGGLRYAGVWVENDDTRVDWSFRDEVTTLADNYIKAEPTAGMSIAIMVNGDTKFMRGWGFQDVANEKEAHAQTVYRHASVAKAITSMLVFHMKLDRSKKTRDFEPAIPAHHTHTLGQLLANRGKVRHYLGNNDPLSAGTDIVYTSALEASKLFSADPLVAQNYLYSTHGYTLAAAAMEKATGKKFPKILTDEFSTPFGLSTLRCEDLNANVEERSKIYSASGNSFNLITPKSLSWKYAGGGMESSAHDLARLGSKLLSGGVMSAADLNTMTTAPDALSNYAFGWDTGTDNGQKVFAKSGGQPGSRAYIRCYPDKKIVIAILCNTSGDNIAQLGRDIGALLIK